MERDGGGLSHFLGLRRGPTYRHLGSGTPSSQPDRTLSASMKFSIPKGTNTSTGLPDRSGRALPSLGRQKANHRILPRILRRCGQGRNFQNRIHLFRHVGTLSEADPCKTAPRLCILERLPIVANMNTALNNVRAEETSRRARSSGNPTGCCSVAVRTLAPSSTSGCAIS